MFTKAGKLLVGLVLSAAAACGQSAALSHSAMFRGDLSHTGVYASKAPASIRYAVWRFKTGGRIFSSPVVADGILYIGSNDHFVHALDAKTGHEIWKFETGANVTSTPVVADGSVYVVSLDGRLYSLDAGTGKLRWKFQTGGESRLTAAGLYGLAPSGEIMPDPWDFFLSSPAVYNGRVYFGSGDRNIYALNARTGRLVWKYQAGDIVHSSPAIANGIVYIGCWDGAMYALNARNGRLIWKFETGGDTVHFMEGIPGSAAISGGIVVFGSRDGNIYAVAARSGKQLWRQPNNKSWVISSPAIDSGVVYATTSDSMKFRALDLKTGKPLFDIPYKAYSFSSPAIANGHAFFGTFDGIVYDVDLNSRSIHSRFRVAVSLQHRKLLTADGHLNGALIFGPLGPDGKPNNTLDALIVGVDRLLQLGSILSSPCVADGIVYVSSTDGLVYALR